MISGKIKLSSLDGTILLIDQSQPMIVGWGRIRNTFFDWLRETHLLRYLRYDAGGI
jgi:hypothetical protein